MVGRDAPRVFRLRARVVAAASGTVALSLRLIVLSSALLVGGSGCLAPKRVVEPSAAEANSAPPSAALSTPLAAEPWLVQVGLAVGASEVVLAAEGPCYLLGDAERSRLAHLTAPRLTIARVADRLHWRDAAGSGGDAARLVLQPVDPGDRVRWNDLLLRGELIVFPAVADDGLTVVNAIASEAYLRGVVPWEIGRPGRAALAALAAQAIAARTYTASHMSARASLGFDLWADVTDQVYRGAADEDPVCDEAIAATAGLVLRDGDDLVEAYYSAACGGITSQIEEVWPRPARSYLVAHPDRAPGASAPFCAAARHFAWEESWDGAALATILQRTLPAYIDHMARADRAAWAAPCFTPARRGADPARPGALLDLAVAATTCSGRVARLDVRCEAGTYHLRGDRVRWVLVPASGAPSILRSAWFTLEVERRDGRVVWVRARGRGYGHGVGLCQTGALAMARAGYRYEDILAHYYPGTRLAAYRGAAELSP